MQLNSANRLILTGTPLENSTMDLWTQMTFINPGLLGTQSYFKNEYQIPIEKHQDKKQNKRLYSLIKPFMLRRHKSQVATELPPKVESIHYCDMTEEQEKSLEAQRKLTLLNEQIAALRGQLANLQGLLDASAARDAASQVQLENLGSQLNAALAQVAAEEKRRAALEPEIKARAARLRAAGDVATDYNHYTKRAILGSVYAATLLIFVNDDSEEWADTQAFLARRIDGIMRFEKAKAKWTGGGSDRHFSMARFLGRLRYPAA